MLSLHIDEAFPLYAPLPSKISLIFVQSPKEIFPTSELVDDILADKSFRLVGIHGILFLKQHPLVVANSDELFYSPAYPFKHKDVTSGKDDEPCIPYFYRDDNGKIVIKYSRTAAAAIHQNHPILIGWIPE